MLDAVILHLATALLTAGLLVPATAEAARRRGWMTTNYQGRQIPTSVGLVLPAVAVIAWPTAAMLGLPSPRITAALLLTAIGFAALGLLDDRFGDRAVTGLRGHVRALLVGRRCTTGLIKLVGGAAVGILCGLLLAGPRLGLALLFGAVIALSANSVNLLDRRPGRALKGAWLLFALAGAWHHGAWIAAAAIAASVVYAPLDFGCRVTMGDAGANPLGALCGLAACLSPRHVVVWPLLVILILLHLFLERWSLTTIIDNTPWLHRLDALGVHPRGDQR